MAVQMKWYYISLIVLILDQITKFIFKNYFLFTKNTGSLFGLFKGHNLLFIFITLAVIFVIIYYLIKKEKKKRKYEEMLFALILGGAFGNLIDRLVYGAVIDFINLKVWPSFNIADMVITIGVVGLIIYYLEK